MINQEKRSPHYIDSGTDFRVNRILLNLSTHLFPQIPLTLVYQVIIVGNLSDQVKFSELTLDMFRMLQTLEREPQDEMNPVYDRSPAPAPVRVPMENGGGNGVTRSGRENPHKYLLYKPTLPQLMVFLASGYKAKLFTGFFRFFKILAIKACHQIFLTFLEIPPSPQAS